MYLACDGVGKKVLIIRGNKVIGEGKSQTSRDGCVSITLEDDRAKLLVPIELLEGIGYKYCFLHYSMISGVFLGLFEDDTEFDLINEQLSDTAIVDEDRLQYGMVPEHFKTLTGYRKCLN